MLKKELSKDVLISYFSEGCKEKKGRRKKEYKDDRNTPGGKQDLAQPD